MPSQAAEARSSAQEARASRAETPARMKFPGAAVFLTLAGLTLFSSGYGVGRYLPGRENEQSGSTATSIDLDTTFNKLEGQFNSVLREIAEMKSTIEEQKKEIKLQDKVIEAAKDAVKGQESFNEALKSLNRN